MSGAERDEDVAIMYSCIACGTIFYRITDVWLPGVTDRHANDVKKLMIEIDVRKCQINFIEKQIVTSNTTLT
jgi:hypothetical protein